MHPLPVQWMRRKIKKMLSTATVKAGRSGLFSAFWRDNNFTTQLFNFFKNSPDKVSDKKMAGSCR
jgi:hypothetical protein